MSTPAPRRPRPPSPTRQQLDELDDLLQRMLSLPVNPTGGEAAGSLPEASAAPIAVEDGPPRAEDLPPPSPDDPPEPGEPAIQEAPAAVEPTENLFPKLPSPSGGEGSGVRGSDPQGLPPLTPTPLPQGRGACGTDSETLSPPRPLWLGAPWWLRPLVWVNRFFDRRTFRLGALGRWLRRPSGRAALGWAGLLCLAAAAALLLRWIRWP